MIRTTGPRSKYFTPQWQRVSGNIDRNKEVLQMRRSALENTGDSWGPASHVVRHRPYERITQYDSPRSHIPGIRAALRLGKCAEAQKKLTLMRKSMRRMHGIGVNAGMDTVTWGIAKSIKTCKRSR